MVFTKKTSIPMGNVAKSINFGNPQGEPNSMAHLSDDNLVETSQTIDGTPYTPNTPAVAPTETPAPNTEQPAQASAQTVEDDDVEDERFKGKSKKDIYNSYKNLETEVGRHRNELGQMRQFTDNLLRGQLPPVAGEARVQEPDPKDDAEILNLMLGKPSEFMNQIEQKVMKKFQAQGVEQQLNQLKAGSAALRNTPEFVEWINKTIPYSLAIEADSDPVKFQFILNTFNQNKHASAANSTTNASSATEPTRTASNARVVEVGVAAGTSQSKSSGKATYSRLALMDLHRKSPSEYQKMLPDIELAYQEGRVKP